jgi:hypothetical protein
VPVGALAVAVGLALAFMRDSWQYNTLAAIDWASGGLVLMLPLMVGGAAFDGWRMWKGSLGTTLAPTMRSRRGLFSLAAVHAVAAVTAWGLTVGIAYGVAAGRGAVWQFDVYMVVHPVALLIACGVTAVALGATIARPWVSPVLAVVVFLATLGAENSSSLQGFFTQGGHTGWSPTVRYIPWLAVSKAGLWLLVAVAGLLLAMSLEPARGSASARNWTRRAKAAAIGAGLVMVSLAWTQPPDNSGLTARVPDIECTGSAPELCTANEELWIAERYEKPLAEMYQELAPYGITPPGRILDSRLAAHPDTTSASGDLGASSFVGGEPSRDALAHMIAQPALCPAYFGDGADRLLGVSNAVFQWAYLTLPGDEATATWDEVYPNVPKADVDAWIPSAYRALLDCDASGVSTNGMIE